MILLCALDISAHPSSVNILEGINDDVRTPDKLVDGVNSTVDGRHMWLAPILPGVVRSQFLHYLLHSRNLTFGSR